MVSTAAPVINPLERSFRVVPVGLEDLVARLMEVLPPSVSQGLTTILEETQEVVVFPLLEAKDSRALRTAFSQAFPSFAETYVSVSTLLWVKLRDRLLPYLAQVPEPVKLLLLERGPGTIGARAADQALLGWNAITIVQRAYVRRLTNGGGEVPELPPQESLRMVTYILAQSMALTTVTYFVKHRDAFGERARRNARIVAGWSYDFGIQAYSIAKQIGLLKVPPAKGKMPTRVESDEFSALESAELHDLIAQQAQRH